MSVAQVFAMWVHLVARSLAGMRPLSTFDRCAWLWARLQHTFPNAIDCILMPNGAHLVEKSIDATRSRSKLRGVLRGFTRRYGAGQRIWEAVPAPVTVPDCLHRRRTSRYVALNPSRAKLGADPLEWLWSTYRDIMGATASQWVTADRLARALEHSRYDFRRAWHAYVSGDPTVAVAGTPAPTAAPSSSVARFSLQRIQLAAAAAYRVPPTDLPHLCQPRRLFVALARDQAWPTRCIVEACGISMQNARRIRVPAEVLRAGQLCLADTRLLKAVNTPTRDGDSRSKPHLNNPSPGETNRGRICATGWLGRKNGRMENNLEPYRR